jgi:hypothetical protein
MSTAAVAPGAVIFHALRIIFYAWNVALYA